MSELARDEFRFGMVVRTSTDAVVMFVAEDPEDNHDGFKGIVLEDTTFPQGDLNGFWGWDGHELIE